MDATDDGQFSIPSRRRENHRRLVPGLPGHRDGLLGRRMQSERWAFGAVQTASQAARTGRRAPVRRMLSGLAEEDAGNHKEMVLLLSRIMSDRPDAGRETLHKLQVEHRIDLITILGSRPWGDDMLGDAMWSSWGRMRDGAICSMPHGSGVYVDYKQDGSVAEVGLNGYFPTCNVTQSRSGRIVTESSAAEAAALLSTALVAVTCAGEDYQKYTSALGDFARRWLAHLEGSLGAQDLGDMLAWGGALPVVTMVGMLEPIPDAAKNLAVAARDVLARGGMQSLQCPILMSPTQTDYCASLRAVGSVADGAQPLRIYDSATEQIRRYEGGAPYCAVSYVWKEWDDDHLRAKLRWYAADGQGIFWVDRWCINQSDDEEKADQLAKMVHIYARAAETLVLVKSQQDISVTQGWDDLGKAWEEAAWHTRGLDLPRRGMQPPSRRAHTGTHRIHQPGCRPRRGGRRVSEAHGDSRVRLAIDVEPGATVTGSGEEMPDGQEPWYYGVPRNRTHSLWQCRAGGARIRHSPNRKRHGCFVDQREHESRRGVPSGTAIGRNQAQSSSRRHHNT